MIQTNSIWISDDYRQLDNLRTLKPKLRYREALQESECDIQTLPDYDMVFFLLTPNRIGSRFFIRSIEEVLRVRRSSKTIFLAIDDCHNHDEQELLKVKLELQDSVKHLISNPVIFLVSTYYAALHHRYETGEISIAQLQRNRQLIIQTGVDDFVRGKLIQPEHLAQLPEIGRMDRIYRLVEDFSVGLRQAGINAAKNNWLVMGPDRTGKSLVAALLHAKLSDSIHFADIHPLPQAADIRAFYDGLVIVLDLQLESGAAFVEQVCSTYVGVDKIFVVNRMDNFMLHGRSRQSIESEITVMIRDYTGDPLYFVSALYYDQSLRVEKEELSIQDVIDNPDIVLADSLQFPIAKEKYGSRLPELLHNHSGFGPLLQIWE